MLRAVLLAVLIGGAGALALPAEATTSPTMAVTRPAAPNRWVGTFAGFPGPAWAAAWGQSPQKAWGLGGDLTAVADAGAPGGTVLDARYGAHSSAHSCTNCPATGGGEFYTQFSAIGYPEWGTAKVLDLKYFVRFPADGRWHSVEQLVERTAQRVTVWYDGRQVFTTSVTGISAIPFSGVFFSTFFGGHDRSWGPAKAVHVSFAEFSVSTAVQH